MASRKEYEMLFQLNAQLGSNYTKAFQAAQTEITSIQSKIQALSRVQSDIAAYQKQQSAVEATRKKLVMLQQQYDNIQQELQETGNASSALKNQLLSKQLQMERTSDALNAQTGKLEQLGSSLRAAGVDTDNLTASTARLERQVDGLKADQELAARHTQSLASALAQAADGADAFGTQAGEAAEQARSFGSQAGQAFSAVHEALAAAGIGVGLQELFTYFSNCAQAAMDFESAMTGVAKTTDFTEQEFSAMSAAIRQMSTELPATTTELAAIAESAGQLGIQKENLLDFTETMAMLGTSTNMTADEAATNLSRLANITGMSQTNFDRLGATIVDLGNNLATTEKEIVEMSMRIAGAGSQVGMTEAQIMAFSGALSSVGIQAEAGGSSFSTLISDMSLAVQQGGERLEQFAQVAGLSAQQFAQAFEEDAAGAIIQFIQGLGNLSAQGRSAIAVLDEMELSDISMRDALLRAAGASDTFTNALQIGSSAWEANTALTTEASKRYATTQSQLTMMQNAYNNLKVAIGDAYTPALQEAYSIGTKVLNGVTQFVKKNPELVNAVTAFAGVIGAVTLALAAYTAAVKLANIATAAFATVSNVALGPIFAVTAAVAAVTAGIVALATAAANNAVPSVDELTQAAQGMREAMDEADLAFESTATQTLATAEVADQYIAKLEEMGDYTRLAEDEQEQYRNTLSLLCQLVPELSDLIDVQNGTIDGGTAALRANTKAWKENAEAQAYQEYMNQLAEQYNAVMVEAAENSIGLTKSQLQLDAANKKYNDTVDRMNELWNEAAKEAQAYNEEYYAMTDATNFLTQEYYDLESSLYDINDEIWTAQDTMDAYTKAIEEDQEAVAAAKEEMESAQEAIDRMAAAASAGTDVTAEATTQIQEFQSTVTGVKEEINALATAYQEAYEAAFDSISGQYQLWDEAAEIVATSAGTINSALESQVAYWETYNANLQSLTERSADIEGLSEMIASFADGSEDSVNAIAGMAGATDEQLEAMVSNWQALKAEQEEAAGSVADLKTDFTATMDELQSELANDIEAMDLGPEAAESGKATIQGFVSGAEAMLPQVQAAYSRIAQAAIDAIDAKLEIHSPSRVMMEKAQMTWAGYIQQTEAMEPEVQEAMAGVAGQGVEAATRQEARLVAVAPQLLSMLGASQAREAAAVPGSQSIVIHLAPQYTISGISDGAGLEAVLSAQDDNMRELILEVLEEAGIDAGRRAYT